ncbi:MFS transporter [Saxibacter everestensis]|uniref:MFS transporter n=1 Tax=Saxibacter everestensis TaxID=2909229 RepID=A0ABY8QVL0_9MICO|nr:MFS transporter [Brevibacteriaceae bacterium ZFBP1038]
MTSTQPGTSSALAVPITKVGARWIVLYFLAWFAIWIAQLTPTQLLLPEQVDAPNGPALWTDGVIYFSLVFAGGGVAAMITGPITGALSDRTLSRFGRRRPWMFSGLLIAALGVASLGFETSVPAIAVSWVVVSVGICMASAAYMALIADQVPLHQRGFASGIIGSTQAIGVIVGVGLVVLLSLSIRDGYLLMAGLLLAVGLPTVVLLPDAPLPAISQPAFTFRRIVAGMWVSPVRFPNFAWVLLSRALVNTGNALGTGLLLYFLIYGLGDADADDHLLLLISVYTVFVVIASIGGGKLSDRFGRRRLFIVVSAILQALSSILLAAMPSLGTALFSAALLGLGYGCFCSVDLALATEVLPAAEDRAKDLGIMNIAAMAPQAFAPMLGAWLVAITGGFSMLFLAGAVFSLFGAAALAPIRRTT